MSASMLRLNKDEQKLVQDHLSRVNKQREKSGLGEITASQLLHRAITESLPRMTVTDTGLLQLD